MKKLILFELRKVFSKRLALIALIGIILFSALLSFSTFQNKYAFDQNIGEGTGKTAVKIDKEIAAKYEGILTDEKVQQMMSDFAPTHDLHAAIRSPAYGRNRTPACSDQDQPSVRQPHTAACGSVPDRGCRRHRAASFHQKSVS